MIKTMYRRILYIIVHGIDYNHVDHAAASLFLASNAAFI